MAQILTNRESSASDGVLASLVAEDTGTEGRFRLPDNSGTSRPAAVACTMTEPPCDTGALGAPQLWEGASSSGTVSLTRAAEKLLKERRLQKSWRRLLTIIGRAVEYSTVRVDVGSLTGSPEDNRIEVVVQSELPPVEELQAERLIAESKLRELGTDKGVEFVVFVG